MQPMTLGVVIGDKATRDEVDALIREMPVRVLMNQSDITDWAVFLRNLEKLRPDVLLFDIVNLREPLDEAIRKIRSLPVAPMIIVLHRSADPALILGALRAGANEFLCPPLDAELSKALERLFQEHGGPKSSRPAGKSVAFVSAKGGCGATTIACHVAREVARQTKQEVLLADLDLDAGMIGFLTKSPSKYSLLDAAKSINRLDLSLWKALVSIGYRGLEVIPAPTALAPREQVSPGQIRNVLRFTRSHYGWSIVDLGHGLNPLSANVLEEVDQTYVVSTMELLPLHQAQQMARTLLNNGYGPERLRLVLNRVPRRPTLSTAEVEDLVGLRVYAELPNAYVDLSSAYTQGKFVSATSKLGEPIGRLAAKLAGMEIDQPQRKFQFFGQRRPAWASE